MNFSKINYFLIKISRISGFFLFFLMVLYFFSGYALKKGFLSYVLAFKIHNVWLPLPTLFLFLLHSFISLKFFLIKNKLKDTIFLNLFIFLLFLFVFLIFVYLHFYEV